MYFGSVKFFKHLIIGTVALLIIVPCVFCIVLGIENAKKDERIAELCSGETQSGELTPEDMLGLYGASLSEEEKEKFLSLVYENDGELYERAKLITADKPSVPAAAVSAAGSPEDIEDDIDDDTLEEADDDSDEVEDDADDDTDNAPPEETTDDPAETAPAEPVTEAPPAETADNAPAYRELHPELYAPALSGVVYDSDKDYVYLTFDDGPSKYTENILYYLDKYNIKATFFVVPDGTEACAEKLRKIVDAGHTIGVHTASHVYTDIYASVESYLDDFALAYQRIYDATGVKCRLFRFPGGSINDFNTEVRAELIEEMTRRGFVYFDWNVDSSDAMGATWSEMYNNVLTQTANANRAVILMHDYNGGYNTVLVLEDIIKALMSDSRKYKLAELTETVRPVQF